MDLLADPATLLTLVGALVLAGAAIGFLAGLFGVGGGAISVPVFFEIFRVLGYPAGWVYRLESSDPIIGFGLPITSIQMIGRGTVRP